MFKYSFILFLCFLSGSILAQTPIDSSLFTTDKKPLIDKSAKKGGLLGGRVSTSGGPDIDKIKDKYEEKQDKSDDFKAETLPDLGLKVKKIKEDLKEKLRNKNEYEGIKIEKRIAQYGNGNKLTMEEFNVLNDDAEISMYAREIRWFDFKMQRTSTAVIKNMEEAAILHGPYKKYIGEDLVEEGFFYLGTKHGRWARYGKEFDNDFVLLDKTTYKKGYLANSKITYYDTDNKKLKEVMPMNMGKQSGEYVEYYASGNLKTEGHFDDGRQTGKWIEYHEFGKTNGRRKKETMHGKDKFDTEFESFIIREFDNNGQLTFENTEAIKKLEKVD